MNNIYFVPASLASEVFSNSAEIYGAEFSAYDPDIDRFHKYWAWAEKSGMHKIEYLMPQIRAPGHVVPFSLGTTIDRT